MKLEDTLFLIEFFKWCFILNCIVMFYSILMVCFFQDFAYKIHTKLGLYSGDKDNHKTIMFNYIASYKILVIVFNLVPWIALKIIFG